MAGQGFESCHKMRTNWKASWGLSHWESSHDIQTPPKVTFDAFKQAFLAQEWYYFYLMENKPKYLHLKDYLKYVCEPSPPQLKIIVALPIVGQLSQSL